MLELTFKVGGVMYIGEDIQIAIVAKDKYKVTIKMYSGDNYNTMIGRFTFNINEEIWLITDKLRMTLIELGSKKIKFGINSDRETHSVSRYKTQCFNK